MQLEEVKFEKSSILNLPNSPGVYLYKNGKGKVLYVGKAKNLKNRVYSYLSNSTGEKTKNLIKNTKNLSYYIVSSELEALLLEAKLIRKYKPKYNSDLKDDKRPLFIVITNDYFPFIKTTRRIEGKIRSSYGPFPNSGNVNRVLKMVRKIIPFSDHNPGNKVCFNSHIGLCKPCPSEIVNTDNSLRKKELRKYFLRNIRLTKKLLDGKFNLVRKNLLKEMDEYSKNEDYENAKDLREKIQLLDYITQPVTPVENYIKNPNLIIDIRKEELDELLSILKEYIELKSVQRIECYDVSHISGENTTASMVTFIDGEADKSLYRHFRVRQKNSRSDTDSLREALSRRVKYLKSWGIPDLIIVDGGKGQVSVFLDILKDKHIPIIGLVKRHETLIIPVKENGKLIYKEKGLLSGPAKNLVQRLRNEAHRFARRYHHNLVKRNYFSK